MTTHARWADILTSESGVSKSITETTNQSYKNEKSSFAGMLQERGADRKSSAPPRTLRRYLQSSDPNKLKQKINSDSQPKASFSSRVAATNAELSGSDKVKKHNGSHEKKIEAIENCHLNHVQSLSNSQTDVSMGAGASLDCPQPNAENNYSKKSRANLLDAYQDLRSKSGYSTNKSLSGWKKRWGSQKTASDVPQQSFAGLLTHTSSSNASQLSESKVAARLRALTIGKCTPEYKAFALTPRINRTHTDPQTPDIYESKISQSEFMRRVNKWRRDLHAWYSLHPSRNHE